jgi:hypothetical protein
MEKNIRFSSKNIKKKQPVDATSKKKDKEAMDNDKAKKNKFPPLPSSIPLENLVVQQSVTPITDIDELSVLWPVDDDPDDLLSHILFERAQRQKSVQE